MYFFDNNRHHLPHIHVRYNEHEGVFSIESGEMIDGYLPKAKVRLVQAWIEIHHEDLAANWQLAISGERIFPIDPLK
jgi:hypothetical protein